MANNATAARRVRPRSNSSAGVIHTQWCDHETGETRSPAAATATTAASSLRIRGTSSTVSASTARHSTSHADSSTPIRNSSPRRDWFAL